MRSDHIICRKSASRPAWAWSLLSLAMLLAVAGCGGGGSGGGEDDLDADIDDVSGDDALPTPAAPERKVAETADLKVTSQQLYEDCIEFEPEAIAEYDGKTIEITGKVYKFAVNEFMNDPGDRLQFWLAPLDSQWPHNPAPINCSAGVDTMPWERFSVDDEVTIRAYVTVDKYRGIHVAPYELVSTSGGPMKVYTAAELTQRLEEDRAKLAEEMQGTRQLVRGKVARLPKDEEREERGPHGVDVVLEGTEKTEFALTMVPPPKWISPGDELLFLGLVDIETDEEYIAKGHQIGMQPADCLTLPSK